MHKFLLTLAVLTIPMHAQVLNQYRNSNRVVLLFAPSAADPRYLQQLDLFEHHHAEFNERNLIFLPVLVQSGPPVTADTVRIIAPVSDADAQSLRLQYRVGLNEFAAILIGKDGGEKLRSTTPITAARLNATIDAMPMRQDEMQKPRQ